VIGRSSTTGPTSCWINFVLWCTVILQGRSFCSQALWSCGINFVLWYGDSTGLVFLIASFERRGSPLRSIGCRFDVLGVRLGLFFGRKNLKVRSTKVTASECDVLGVHSRPLLGVKTSSTFGERSRASERRQDTGCADCFQVARDCFVPNRAILLTTDEGAFPPVTERLLVSMTFCVVACSAN